MGDVIIIGLHTFSASRNWASASYALFPLIVTTNLWYKPVLLSHIIEEITEA